MRNVLKFTRATLAAVLIQSAFTFGPCTTRADESNSEYDQAITSISADEPLARQFSAERAARYLDAAAISWQKSRKCAACHTMTCYLMARPLVSLGGPDQAEIRQFFEETVALRREAEPALPKDGISAVLINLAAGLAINDNLTTGTLHPLTRQALDRMWTVQRDDGGWQWPYRDVPPIKIREHYGVTLAALAVGLAPDNYSRTKSATDGLTGIRKFLAAHPPQCLHEKAMLLWASLNVADLQTEKQRLQTVADLLAAQRPDGGWSLASLVENSAAQQPPSDELKRLQSGPGHGTKFLTFAGQSGVYESSLDSDGYATGFTIFIARQSGVPRDDPRLKRGIDWLKSNQRSSGRWYTPSQGYSGLNLITNTGTAFSIMALHACGEIP